MRQQHRVGLALVACVATPMLGACGADSKASGEADALTPPGTELKLGETATVPLEGQGIAKFTASSIEKADPADLANVKNADPEYDPTKHDAYDIRYEVTIVSERGDGIQNVDLMSDIGLQASEPDYAVELWNVKTCHIDRGLLQSVQPGDSFSNCLPAYLPKGTPVDGVYFSDPNSDYDQVGAEPVIWRE